MAIKSNLKHLTNKGFTLVELLIVVIILAILAAIVVPQFASTTDDAKVSALDSTLSNVRAAIDLYYQQHGEYPGLKDASANQGTACTATAGTGTGGAGATGQQAFLDQLSMFTDAEGGACSKKEGDFKFGPYLKKNALPDNPVTGKNALEVIATGDLAMGGGAKLGWKYDITVGKFIANDTTADANGLGYDKH